MTVVQQTMSRSGGSNGRSSRGRFFSCHAPIVFDDDEDDFSLLATWIDEERGVLWMAEACDMCCRRR